MYRRERAELVGSIKETLRGVVQQFDGLNRNMDHLIEVVRLSMFASTWVGWMLTVACLCCVRQGKGLQRTSDSWEQMHSELIEGARHTEGRR